MRVVVILFFALSINVSVAAQGYFPSPQLPYTPAQQASQYERRSLGLSDYLKQKLLGTSIQIEPKKRKKKKRSHQGTIELILASKKEYFVEVKLDEDGEKTRKKKKKHRMRAKILFLVDSPGNPLALQDRYQAMPNPGALAGLKATQFVNNSLASIGTEGDVQYNSSLLNNYEQSQQSLQNNRGFSDGEVVYYYDTSKGIRDKKKGAIVVKPKGLFLEETGASVVLEYKEI